MDSLKDDLDEMVVILEETVTPHISFTTILFIFIQKKTFRCW